MAKPSEKTAAQIALIGAETLLGRELQEVLGSRGAHYCLDPYAASAEGNFGEEEGEAIYREPFEKGSLRNTRAILAAGSGAGVTKAFRLFQEFNAEAVTKPVFIDCTGYLENKPGARMVAPLVEQASTVRPGEALVVAHPAATALALVLKRLARHRRMSRAVVQVFEPASERGKRGISELHQQTTGLLSFKPLDKDVFDDQLSFNMLARYGAEAPDNLLDIEERIERHLAMLLRDVEHGPAPIPSIRLVQAPVFHGYSISAWIEFEQKVDAVELGEALASAQIEVRGPEEEAPTGVGAVSQSGLIVGDIRVDRNNPQAAWFWIVADNLRLTADAAVDILGELGNLA